MIAARLSLSLMLCAAGYLESIEKSNDLYIYTGLLHFRDDYFILVDLLSLRKNTQGYTRRRQKQKEDNLSRVL